MKSLKRNVHLLGFVAFLTFYLFTLSFAVGQSCPPGVPNCSGPGVVELPNPLGETTTVSGLLEKIVNFLLYIAVPISTIMILWGAFQILFAAGDEDKFATGKKTIIYAVVGLSIILIGWGFVSIIEDFFQSEISPTGEITEPR